MADVIGLDIDEKVREIVNFNLLKPTGRLGSDQTIKKFSNS